MVLFSNPKPFTSETRDVQITAIRSWRRALPKAKILLFGNDGALPEICRNEGIQHGGKTPYLHDTGKAILSHLFQTMGKSHPEQIQIYLNSDIVLGPGIGPAMEKLASLRHPWLATARRRCLSKFAGESWPQGEIELRLEKLGQGWKWGPPDAIDIFAYWQTGFEKMPDFAVGHCAWDNWMIYHARQQGIVTIDATADLDIYHFEHGYQYSKGNTSIHQRAGPLEERNLRLLGGEGKRFHLGHATHELRGGQLRKRGGTAVWQRNLELWRLQNPRWERAIKLARSILHPMVRAWEKNTAAKEREFR